MESIFIACRWAGSLGIFGWLMIAMANPKPTEQTKDQLQDQPQDVPTQVTETRSKLPPISTTEDSTVRDIMQLRARFGTGLGTPEEFRSAIESMFKTDSDATDVKKAAVYWNEDMSSKSESATCRRGPIERPIVLDGALPPLEATMRPMLSQPIPQMHSQPLPLMYSQAMPQMHPQPVPPMLPQPMPQMHPQPMPQMLPQPMQVQSNGYPAMSLAPYVDYPPSNANVATNFVSGQPRTNRSQVLRKTARLLEDFAWELETIDEYTLADQLRKQAVDIYHQARQVQ